MSNFANTKIFKDVVNFTQTIQSHFPKQTDLQKRLRQEALSCLIHTAQALQQPPQKEFSLFKKPLKNLQAIDSLLFLYPDINNFTDLRKQIHELSKKLTEFSITRPKILILTAKIGHGHLTAANSLKQGIEHLYGLDYDIEIIDFLEFTNEFASQTGTKVYLQSLKYFPSIFKFIYESFDKKQYIKLLNLLNYPLIYTKIGSLLKAKSPALIISTHPLWDYSINKIWKKINQNAKFITMITDSISVHAAWATGNSDFFIVSNPETAESLRKFEIAPDKIKTLGFPLDLRFYEDVNRSDILKKYNLTSNNFTILLIANLSSSKQNLSLIKKIAGATKNSQLIILTCQNKSLSEHLKKAELSLPCAIIEWTDDMALLMKSCDLIIGKAGGATTQECIASQKPIIVTQVLPGQEEGNAKLIELYKMGEISRDEDEVIAAIKKIQKNYSFYQNNLKKLLPQNATLKIAEFIIKSLK